MNVLFQTCLSQTRLSQARLSQASLSKTRLSLALSFILALLAPFASKASQVLTLAENKRVEAAICPDSMNRIAIANDRITHIFGDEGTFESQNDENTGQVFLKPTVENGAKSLSLTLITEQGITQDLTLKPTAKSATTLIFKNFASALRVDQKSEARGMTQNPLNVESLPGFSPEKNFNLQDHLLVLLKQAVAGQLPLQDAGFLDDGYVPRASSEGFELSHHQTYASGSYLVFVFHVKNTTKTAIVTHEKSFYQAGDLAISLQQSKVDTLSKIDSQSKVDPRRILPAGAESLLYVVRMAERGAGGEHD
jgi:hypothetical protein